MGLLFVQGRIIYFHQDHLIQSGIGPTRSAIVGYEFERDFLVFLRARNFAS
jgi:hypothetical protein